MNGSNPFYSEFTMGDQETEPDLDIAFEILAGLVRSCQTPAMIQHQSYPPTLKYWDLNDPIPFPESLEPFFKDQRVLRQMLSHYRNNLVYRNREDPL